MKKERLVSLDAFRGFTIAAMIVVNNPGSWNHVYSPLLHSEWTGCTPTDLVFPFFMFIVGLSMWFSFKTYNYEISKSLVLKIVQRSAVIFMIGAFLNAFPFNHFEWHSFRIPGVLQRIAIAYFLAAFLCILFNKSTLMIISVLILSGYYILLLIEGGPEPFSLTGNLVKQVDITILGESHLYNGFGIPFDPEGLLSTLPSLVTVIIGFLTGNFLEKVQKKDSSLLWLFFSGILLIIAGLLFSFLMPVIKALWTSSYVLLTAGIACIILCIFVFAFDFKKWKRIAQPFVVLGSNSIFIYAFSGILGTILYLIPVGGESLKDFAYNHYFIHLFGYRSGSLFGALLLLLICWFAAWLLNRKRIYIKI